MRILLALLVVMLMACPESAAQSPSFQMNGMELELPSPVTFRKGTATLEPSSTAALEHIKAYLEAKDYITTMRIEGHAADQALSEQRAAAVVLWLVKAGADCKRLLPVGFGATKPILEGDYSEGSANTRITAVNAALRSRAIGGMPLDGGGKIAGAPCE